jgi:glycosyltransferase involved in cell wall biosynthesis
MRIDMVSEHASPLAALGDVDAGGQNVHVAQLAAALARRGAEVVVHTRRDDPGLPERVPLAAGVTVRHVDAGPAEQVPKDELLPHMGRFADVLRDEWAPAPPDVVHSHFWMSGLAALAAADGLPVPVAHTFHALGVVKRRHQGAADTSPPERIALERWVAAGADRVVATCSDEVFELVREGADRRRLSVVPCGVDTRRFTPDGPAEDAPRPRIACVGRMVERKGVADVIRALPDLPGVELVIAGGPPAGRLDDDPEAVRLRGIAEELGVAGRVDMRGGIGRDAVAPLMRSAVAVVCAPWYEPFGIVPLEAMACGVPVIASSVGGMIDTVVHDVTGVHVPPRDPGRIAAAVRGLLDHPARRAALGRAGVARARQRYTWDRVAAGTLDAYALCGAGARGAAAEVRR